MFRDITPFRIVIAGCGAQCRWGWLQRIRDVPGYRIVGAVDLRLEAAQRVVDEFWFKDALAGADLGQVLDATRPDILLNLTVPEAHCTTTVTALARGCHVICEKPMAASLDEARRMIAAADAAGRLLVISQNGRFEFPAVHALGEFLASGAIGPITTVHEDYFIAPHFGGFRDRMPHVLLLDEAIHSFDLARYFTGQDPTTVYCKEWNPADSWYDRDASAVAVFEMTGGLVYTYRGSWCSEGLPTRSGGQWRFIGTRGTATWDGHETARAEVVVETKGIKSTLRAVEIPPYTGDMVGNVAGILRHVLRCLREGVRPACDGRDNIRSLAMVFGAIDSAAAARPVPVSWDV